MKSSIYLTVISVMLIACNTGGHQEHAKTLGEQASYTCPMHPTVESDKPGSCPICGMDLVVRKGTDDGNSVMLSESQIILANITTEAVGVKPIGQTLLVNGRLVADEERTEVVSSRVPGRVEKLFIKETGRQVQHGEALFDLYSETLLTIEREFLLAKEQYETVGKRESRYASFVKAAEEKLHFYGLTQKQIDELAASKQAKPRITFLSPATGIVNDIRASEGQYVAEGDLLYRIEDLRQLLVEAELYPAELALMKKGDRITVMVSGFETTGMETTISFMNPEYKKGTQITLIRATLPNPELKFKPGMQAQIQIVHSEREAIAIPTDAVIRDGHGTHVYVQVDTGTFQPRRVRTGVENFQQVEITGGLEVGERVVVTGAYLIYSELILKKGTNPMAGHPEQAMSSKSGEKGLLAAASVESINPEFSRQLVSLLTPYLKIKDALVASNPTAAAAGAKELDGTLDKVDMRLVKGESHLKWMELQARIRDAGKAIGTSTDIGKQRTFFSELTASIYESIKIFKVTELQAYYQFCPMAFDNKGAYWISREKEISNPYFGDEMLRCGETTEALK